MRPETWPGLGLNNQNLLVYLDCEVLGEGRHEEIFGQLAVGMAATLEEQGLPPEAALESAIARPSRLGFEGAIRKLNQRGLRVVLILDEFERLSVNPHLDLNFFNALRSAAGRYQLVFLTASARPLIELTYSGRSQEILSSPFFNIFAPLFLGPLEEADARRLIQEPALAEGVAFPPATVDFIYEFVGGHPFALQVACFYAFESPNDRGEIERKTGQELAAHFQYYWRNLSPTEQDTLAHISGPAIREPGDTTLRAVLRDLVQKCLLVYRNGHYQHPSRAWAEFVATQGGGQTAAVSSNGANLSGRSLGVYEVLEPLGRGGMADVYKGYHPRLDRHVAIKVLPAEIAVDADFRQRFEREARAVAGLKHGNIVQVFDFGDVDGLYYMVMEYIAGKDLAHLIQECSILSLAQALPFLRDIANALDYAHSQGLVHRDVKPSNVLLEPAGYTPAGSPLYRAILSDFGIVRLLGDSGGITQSTMIGTLDYMAPEQIHGSSHVDGRADIYALGVMSYQMITGQLPFASNNIGAILMAHLQQAPPDPRRLAPELPEKAAQAIIRALAKDPAQRYRTAGEFVAALT
jgi:serine/threonine protein kinase